MAPRRRAARPAGDFGVDLCEIVYVNFPEFTFRDVRVAGNGPACNSTSAVTWWDAVAWPMMSPAHPWNRSQQAAHDSCTNPLSAFLRHAPIRCPVKNALLCTEASSTASVAILVGIQGDTSFTAAAFSRRTFVATAPAIKPIEDNVCAYTAATEVFRRRTAAVPALFLALWARTSPAFRGSSPGHPRDGSQNSTDNGATY